MLKWAIVGLLILTGCTIQGQLWDYWFDFPYANEITDAPSAYLWVALNTIYQEDSKDEWKTPEQTYMDRGGDCEDVALLMMYLCYQYAHQTPTLIEIDRIDKIHMIVEVDGIVYDPKGSIRGNIQDLEYRILNSYTYGEAMYLAVYVK